jgi:hypothetical protein
LLAVAQRRVKDNYFVFHKIKNLIALAAMRFANSGNGTTVNLNVRAAAAAARSATVEGSKGPSQGLI